MLARPLVALGKTGAWEKRTAGGCRALSTAALRAERSRAERGPSPPPPAAGSGRPLKGSQQGMSPAGGLDGASWCTRRCGSSEANRQPSAGGFQGSRKEGGLPGGGFEAGASVALSDGPVDS